MVPDHRTRFPNFHARNKFHENHTRVHVMYNYVELSAYIYIYMHASPAPRKHADVIYYIMKETISYFNRGWDDLTPMHTGPHKEQTSSGNNLLDFETF